VKLTALLRKLGYYFSHPLARRNRLGTLARILRWQVGSRVLQHPVAMPSWTVRAFWCANGMKLSGGTIVDATLIAAPPSTKNQDKSRDPEMHQSKKGNEWYFGMKLHIGADSQSGLVHSASVTAGNVHDSHELPNLLHGEETRLYGDSAYRGEKQRERLKDIAPKAKDFTNKRAYKNRPLSDADKQTNRRKSSVRSKIEHPFLTLKRIWGFAKVRYRGLAKNANRAFAMLAMLNLVKWGRPLIEEVRPA
jgi:IS5 family transposase